MDFQIAGPKGTTTIFSTHQRGPADASPLQMISAERLAYYVALEHAVLAYRDAIGKLLPALDQPKASAVPTPNGQLPLDE